jgi:transposase
VRVTKTTSTTAHPDLVRWADRFCSRDACARHNRTAPLPVWSGNQTRHRLSPTGNRQLNCAIRRIVVTQIRCHPPAQEYLKARIAAGQAKRQALPHSSAVCPTSSTTLLARGTSVPLSQAA